MKKRSINLVNGMMKNIYSILFLTAVIFFAGCKARNNYPGLEYAPNMYHSIAYDPLTQITDKNEGNWLSSDNDGYGEFYNSNPNNPHKMNLRLPPPHTVRRTRDGWFPYHIPKDSVDMASRLLKNPLDSTAALVEDGHQLFLVYCLPCHGEQGHGDGPVGKVFKGVPAYNAGATAKLTEGHIFHVISYGIRRMQGYSSQIPQEDRWKIVRYVQVLQKQQ
jgi:hypothetical protein